MVNIKNNSEKWTALVFMFPALLLVLLVSIYPIFVAIKWSMYETSYVKAVKFIGSGNFIQILGSKDGLKNISNSLIYVFSSLVVVIPLSTMLAVLLNKEIRLRILMRTVIILPWVISQTVTALLWKWIVNSNYGPIIYAIQQLGGPKLDFLNTPAGAKISLVIANTWNTFPIALVLVLAALQTIPRELYEAGMVDGATGWRAFTRITLPLIKPTISVTVIMLSLEYFNMVTLIYVFTGGGPFNATETLSLRAFKEGFDYWNVGLGSAFSVIIFIFNILLSLLYVRVLKSNEQ